MSEKNQPAPNQEVSENLHGLTSWPASPFAGGGTSGWWATFDEVSHAPGVVLFRKAFPAPQGEGPASIDITCNGTYRLWWNGVFVQRGPAHSGTQSKRIDRIPIDPGLLREENEILIECIWVPYKTAFCPPSPPGLWCGVHLGGQCHEVNQTWRCREHPSYRKQTVRRSPALTAEEHYDARKEPTPDGEGWAAPVSIPGKTAAWPRLIGRGIPFLAEETVFPAKVVKTAEISPEEFTPDSWPGFSIQSLAVHLLKEMPEEHTVTRVENAAGLCNPGGTGTVIIQPSWMDPDEPNQKNTTLILDFGRELAAYFVLDVEGNEGAVIDIAYSEFLKYGRVPALTHQVHYADRTILREGRQTHEISDWKGFRYIQLTIRHLTRPLTIYSATAKTVCYPYKNRDSFTTDDATLDRIWAICDHGRRVCSQDRFVDCPWREQAPWLLDAWLAAKVVYGDPRLRAKTIEDFLLSQNPDGSFPTASYSSSFCHDQSFTLPPLIEQQFCETQEMALLEAALPALWRFYEWIESRCNSRGLIENIGPVHLDWAHFPDKSGCLSIMNGLFGWSLQSLSRMATKAGRKDIIKYCTQRANTLKQAANTAFWDEDKQMYRDSLAAEPHFSEQAQAICVLAGFYDGDAAALLSKVSRMTPGEITKTNLYFAAFWIEALTVAGLRQEALAYIRRVWGRMVDDGASTPWEIEQRFGGYFHPGYWHLAVASSCHGGYASYPQYWFQREVLGVRGPDIDGRIIIRPGYDLLPRASGTVHFPNSCLQVAWDLTTRTICLGGCDPGCCDVTARWTITSLQTSNSSEK